MNVFISFLLFFAYLFCPLAALLLFVRLVFALFSPKVNRQIETHPYLHLAWGIFASVGILFILGILNVFTLPPRFMERTEQRHRVLERVEKAGGWESIRLGCDTLVTNYPDGLTWFRPETNATLPSAIAALEPREIRYYPPRFLPADEPQVAVVQIRIFGMHATGGHSTPYFGLEVVCSTNSGNYRPQPSHGGVPGNSYTSYRQVSDGIYEIY